MGTALAALALAAVAAPNALAAVNTCSGTGGSFAGGAGTTANPYLVSNQAQLEAIRSSSYRTCAFRQTTDISLTGSWTPIGTSGNEFTGEYDGNGKSVTGLNVTGSQSFAGLFGCTGRTRAAVISNLFVSGTVATTGYAVGAIGMADTGTVIVNVHADVDVTGNDTAGGLVGWGPEATIERSSATGNVTVTSRNGSVGGLVGEALGRTYHQPPFRATITDSYATGNVTGPPASAGTGGLVGKVNGNDVRIIRSYSTGAVAGGTTSEPPYYGTSGGLIGPDPSAPGGGTYTGLTVTGSFWDTQTTGKATSANGLGTGKTTAAMKSLSTFTGASWDIAEGWDATKTWGICDGSTYPFLTGQYTATPCAAPTPTPGPTPTPDPTPSPDPSPSPTPEPKPGPTPMPSNAFTMRPPRAVVSTIATPVRVPGPGRLVLHATRNSNAAARVTACRATRSVDRARSVVLRCKANAATRAAQRRGAVRLSVTVTYTPTGGTARTSTARTVVLKSTRPAFTG